MSVLNVTDGMCQMGVGSTSHFNSLTNVSVKPTSALHSFSTIRGSLHSFFLTLLTKVTYRRLAYDFYAHSMGFEPTTFAFVEPFN